MNPTLIDTFFNKMTTSTISQKYVEQLEKPIKHEIEEAIDNM